MSSDPSADGGPDSDAAAPDELGAMIDDLLGDLTGKFNAMNSELTAKLDDMSRRIDNLEASMRSAQTKDGDGDGDERRS